MPSNRGFADDDFPRSLSGALGWREGCGDTAKSVLESAYISLMYVPRPRESITSGGRLSAYATWELFRRKSTDA